MVAPWIASSSRLPEPGERIEFVQSGRDVAIEGSYGSAGFQSHWSNYGLVRVVGWRSLPAPVELLTAVAAKVFPGLDAGAASFDADHSVRTVFKDGVADAFALDRPASQGVPLDGRV